MRVVAGEQLDPAAIDHPEARGRVGDLLAGDRREDDREDQVAEAAAERHLVAGVTAEAGPVDHVGLLAAGPQRVEHLRQVLGLVLAVAVDLDGDVVAVSERVLVAGLHRAADAEVEGMAEDHRPFGLGLDDGFVGRAVVDDEDVEPWRLALDVANDAADHPLLVVGGNDCQQAQVLAIFGRHGDGRVRARPAPFGDQR